MYRRYGSSHDVQHPSFCGGHPIVMRLSVFLSPPIPRPDSVPPPDPEPEPGSDPDVIPPPANPEPNGIPPLPAPEPMPI